MTVGSVWDELAIWLVPITIGIFVIQYYAIHLVVLYVIYFVTLRLLENINVGGLRQKPIVITGCDSGFGFDLVLKCLREGMPVFAACFCETGEKALSEAASKIPDSENLLNTFQMNVANEESVKKAREFVLSKIDKEKGIWGVVNNAGIGDLRGWDDWQTPALYQRMWDVNCLGVIRVTHAFKDLVKRQHGRIVNVSSVMAKIPMPLFGTYSVSKYAVSAYTDIIRAELAQFGVIVCCLEPGFFRSPQANPSVAGDDIMKVWNRVPDEIREEYGEEYAQWSKKTMSEFLEYKCQSGSHKVVDAYFNALTSAYPRRRYQIGYDSIFQTTPFSYLPTRWQDWVFRFYFTFINKQPRTKIVY